MIDLEEITLIHICIVYCSLRVNGKQSVRLCIVYSHKKSLEKQWNEL